MRRLQVLFLLLILALGLASCSPDKSKINFPKPSGYANDYAGVLTAAELARLDSIANGLKHKNGAELAVVVVKSTAPLDSKSYAIELFKKWGIGEKKKDNGVLLLLAMDERRVEIEVGYGMEGILPDAKCGRILDTYAVPSFKQGRMGSGLIATANALATVMAGGKIDLRPLNRKSSQDDFATVMYVMMMLVGGLPFIIIFSLSFDRPWMILTAGIGLLAGWFLFGWLGSLIGGLVCWVLGWFTHKVDFSGWAGNGDSSSSTPSSSPPSPPTNNSSDSFGGFSGGSSGGGGAGRSW